MYLKLPSKLLTFVDRIVEEEGYTSRQEFVRDILRQILLEYKKQELHKTASRLKSKSKVKRLSPLLTKSEKKEVITEYLKKRM